MDKISKERRSENMRRIKSKNMKPELIVRKLVHGMGYRYRLHRSDLPGKPDLVFGSKRCAIFVHGCFWHQHDCKDGKIPSSNQEYWVPKLARNVDRDKTVIEEILKHGWRVLIIWECETKKLEELRQRILDFLK